MTAGRVLCLCTLLLGGCGGGPATQDAACDQQVYDDPAVKTLLARAAGNEEWQWQHAEEFRNAKQDAKIRCLRARGLAPKGSVERPR